MIGLPPNLPVLSFAGSRAIPVEARRRLIPLLMAWTMSGWLVHAPDHQVRAAGQEAQENYDNARLQKEFPLSVQILHQGGSAFVDKSKISPSDLGLLRAGDTLSIKTADPTKTPQTGQPSSTDGLTLETLEAHLRRYLDDPPRKNPGKGFNMPDGLPVVRNAYRGWNYLDVIVFNNWHNKEHIKRFIPTMDYTSSGELFLETLSRQIPPEHSNKEAWINAGLKTRKQDGNNCGLFAITSLNDVLQIMVGKTAPDTSPDTMWRTYRKMDSASSGRLLGISTTSLVSALSMHGAGDNSRSNRLEVRNCSNFKFDPSEFPRFIRKGVDPSLDPELSSGLRDRLMRHEISQGRPVVLDFEIPKAINFDKIHPKNGKQEIVIRLGSSYRGQVDPHAGLVVGYKQDPEDPEATLYEFLNSWGNQWGNGGYAWISSKYLDAFSNSGATIAAYSVTSAE